MISTVGVTSYLSYCAALPASPNCRVTSLSEIWAPDHAYKATLVKKDCNLGESIFYSVRIDAFSPPLRDAWFSTREIEDDEYPAGPPDVRWSAERQLEITMPTRAMSGSVTDRAGDDLVVVRIYLASKPEAFPNYPK
jgi:hypothetical protein